MVKDREHIFQAGGSDVLFQLAALGFREGFVAAQTTLARLCALQK